MTSPAAPRLGTAAFHNLVDQAAAVHETADFALKMGVFPIQIVDYVRGAGLPHEREEIAHQAATIPWVMGRIIALVRARRNPASLGAKILVGQGDNDPYVWGIRETGDRDLDLATLLDRVQ